MSSEFIIGIMKEALTHYLDSNFCIHFSFLNQFKKMARQQNTDRNGFAWSEPTKRAVWQRGSMIPEFSPDVWRRDKCGKVMLWTEHGNRNAETGWEIDHINPVANGGNDNLDNLQPLTWKNNTDKGDSLYWSCP